MNKGLAFIVGITALIASGVGGFFRDDFDPRNRYGSQRGLPHNGHHGKQRLRAPNDGRWHMKYHRRR